MTAASTLGGRGVQLGWASRCQRASTLWSSWVHGRYRSIEIDVFDGCNPNVGVALSAAREELV